MSNRLQSKIKEAAKKREKLFCAFLTLGYPSLAATGELVRLCEENGVDMIELGIPFSDPLADGPTIQYSSEHALRRGVSLRDGLNFVRTLRSKGLKLPLICFSYLNPIYQYGLKTFASEARRAGFDGVIIPDLPPEQEPGFNLSCGKAGLLQIFLTTPTTEMKRASMIGKRSKGFVYYVSLRGVTGARKKLSAAVTSEIRRVRGALKQPVLVGFGVSNPEQAKRLAGSSDGVIVGSALIDQIRKNEKSVASVASFLRRMVQAAKNHR